MTRFRYFLCALVLLAGTGLSSVAGNNPDHSAPGIQSRTKELFKGVKDGAEGKVSFKCRIIRKGEEYSLLACILQENVSVHIVKPGVTFAFEDGSSLILNAEIETSCCSNWADGRWYNAEFKLTEKEKEALESNAIASVTIPHSLGVISRSLNPSTGNAISSLISSVENEK